MSFLFRYLRFHDIIGGIHVPVDDGVDKLNRKYTLLVFLFLALPIFTKQYIGDPIECFAPVYFAEHQSRYINSYCWTQSTYYMVPVGDPEDDGDQQEPPDRIMPDEVDYFIGFETVTHIGNERLRRVRVSYYQWAPLILLVQGLCFYIPFLIWNSCANNAGVKLRRLLKKASDIASLPPGCQQREALLAEFVDQFHTLVTGEAGWCADLQCQTAGDSPAGSAASSQASSANSNSNGPARRPGAAAGDELNEGRANRNHHSGASNKNGCCLAGVPLLGSLLACCLKPCSPFALVGPSKYLCLLYLAVKTAYVFNVALQFFLLGQFLGRGYLKHGLELINRLIVNGDWWASPRFPLSTLCQVRADMSGGLRSYTCQCVLPINVFNEKIFSVVWFYMAFLMPLNVLSLLFWIYRTFETNRLSYIRLCLWRTRLVELNQIHRTVRRLSQSYLGWDGVFLLRLIEHNHGSIMATLIMSRLWEFYANQMKLQEDQNQLALANNAQHALSNTTTAISNQHQLLAAAAAAAAAGAGNSHQGHSHGHGSHGGGHAHPHPLMPAPPPGQQHFSHGHGGGGHAQQQQQFAAGNPHPPMAPMIPHGPHAHHSGQINQPGPAHHPLHAANTHALAHGHAHGHAHLGHLSGPFATSANPSNASLLAQLQHAAQHQQQAPGNNNNNNNNSNNSGNNQQQSAPGNVAAAVAALAAAAAANNQQTSNSNNSTITTTTTSANPTTGPIHLHALVQSQVNPQQAGGQLAQSQAANNSSTSAAAIAAAPASSSSAAQQPVGASGSSGATTTTTSFITPAAASSSAAAAAAASSAAAANLGPGPPLPPPPPAHVVAAVAAGGVAPGMARTGASGTGRQVVGAINTPTSQQVPSQQQQQQQQQHPVLFNLKSSSVQAASGPQGTRYPTHTMKRS